MSDPDLLHDFPCPDFLNEHGASEWNRIIPLFAERGLLDPMLRPALEGYCAAYGRWRSAEEAAEGDDADPNAKSMEIGRYVRQVRGFMADLGMLKAPAQRPEPPEEDDDPLADLNKFFADMVANEHTH